MICFIPLERRKYKLLKKEDQRREYKKYMQIWYGNKRKSLGYFTMMDNRKEELKIKKNEKCELTKHYKKVIDERDKLLLKIDISLMMNLKMLMRNTSLYLTNMDLL